MWKDITGYEGLYQISNYGDVKSFHNYGNQKERIMKLCIKKGYYEVGLRKNGIKKYYLVHKLVANAFIPNPNNLPCINHKDENKLNNNVNNLEWCTYAYNNSYGDRLKRVSISNKLKKEVCKLNINGEILNVYKSIREASRMNNIDFSSISKCINNNRNFAGGYIWKLKSEVMPNA